MDIIKNNQFTLTNHDYNARQILNINVPFMNRKFTKSSFLYTSSKLFNNLPLEIKQST